MAATIQDAIDGVAEFIGTWSGTVPAADQVPARMAIWLAKMFTAPASFPAPGAPWDQGNADQRTVYDWVIPTILANTKIQALGNGTQAGNVAINVVLRALLAVQAAFTAGRITADQQTSAVAAWNDSWETSPPVP